MILTAVALSTGSIALIGVGSAAGGALLTAGSYAVYRMLKSQDDPDINEELRTLNDETGNHIEQETQSFRARNNQINARLSNTTSQILSNQEAIAHVQTLLTSSTDDIQENHKNVRIIMVDLDESNKLLNTVLQGFIKIKEKNRNLMQANEDIFQKYNAEVENLAKTTQEYKIVKEAILDASGERDYIGNMIDLIGRMKTGNIAVENKHKTLLEDYSKKESDISEKSLRITKLLKIADDQTNRIKTLEEELSSERSKNKKLNEELSAERNKNKILTAELSAERNKPSNRDYSPSLFSR